MLHNMGPLNASNFFLIFVLNMPLILFFASAPCAVQSVLSSLNCSTNILTISWEAGPVAVNYSATAVDTDGTALSCMTHESHCTIANLDCGQQYTVTVKAIGGTCEGHSSDPETVNSGKPVTYPNIAACFMFVKK